MDASLSTNSSYGDDVQFVSSSAQPSAEIDIVIVDDHSGKGRDTWAESKNLFERLCHLYPEDLKSSRSRILVFDYCATADPSWNGLDEGRKTISEQAQQLLDLILKQRNTWGTNYRPIIFIAHGLGGMVVEEALKLSIESGYKKSSWTQQVSLISNSTYGVFLFSSKSSLDWRPREWDRVTSKELKRIDSTEHNRSDVEAGSSFSKLYCHHHERLQLPSLVRWTRRVGNISLLLGQAVIVAEATMMMEADKSLELAIFLIVPYVLYAVVSYTMYLRDKYQKHIVTLGILIGSIPSTYLFMTGEAYEVIITILAACLTLSIGLSALLHWRFPNRLANEEWKAFHMIKQWAERPDLGGAGDEHD